MANWKGMGEIELTGKSARVFKWKPANVLLDNGVRPVTLKLHIEKLQLAGG